MLFSTLKKRVIQNQWNPSDSNAVFYLALLAVVCFIYLPLFLHVDGLRHIQKGVGQTEPQILPVYNSDSVGFVVLADNILNLHRFSSSDLAYEPETFRTPGYPVLIAAWKGIFGSYRFLPLLQIILMAGTAVMIYFLGKEMFSKGVGFFAALFFAIDPNTMYHSIILLSEITYVFLLVLAFFLFFGKFRLNFPKEALAGLVLGVAVIVKPISVFLPFVLAVIYFFYKTKHGFSKKSAVLAIVSMLLCFAVPVVPWFVRNHTQSGSFGISSVSSFNLFFYNVPEFLSFRDGISPDQGRQIMFDMASNVPSDRLADLRYSNELTKASLNVIKEDPIGYAKFHLIKTIPFFLSSGLENVFVTYNDILGKKVFEINSVNMTDLLGKGEIGELFSELKKTPWITLEQVFWLAVFGFAVIAVLSGKFNRLNSLVLFLTVLYFAVLTGPVAYARFRLPATPFLLLLAVAGFLASMDFIWRRRKLLAAKPKGSQLSFHYTTKKLP